MTARVESRMPPLLSLYSVTGGGMGVGGGGGLGAAGCPRWHPTTASIAARIDHVRTFIVSTRSESRNRATHRRIRLTHWNPAKYLGSKAASPLSKRNSALTVVDPPGACHVTDQLLPRCSKRVACRKSRNVAHGPGGALATVTSAPPTRAVMLAPVAAPRHSKPWTPLRVLV